MTAKSDSKPYGFIYCITNKVNGKKYIGQTNGTIAKRWKNHISDKTGCRLLKNAFAKYGIESFEVCAMAEADDAESLNTLEVKFIADFQTQNREFGYNLNVGGKSGPQHPETIAKRSATLKGRPLSAEHCAKLSIAHMGHSPSEETRRKMSKPRLKKYPPKTPEQCAAISAGKLGKPLGPKSAEHRAKLSAAHKGRVHGPVSEETRKKIGDAQRGIPKVVSPEAKIRMAEMLRNREYSAETREKMSNSHKGKVQSKELVEKRAAANRGRKNTEETKLKMSAARLAYFAAKKAAQI